MADLRKKRNFSINLPESMIEELDELREIEHRSRSNLVEYFLKIGIKCYRENLHKSLDKK